MDAHTTGCIIDLGENRIKKYLELNSFWVIERFDNDGKPTGVYMGHDCYRRYRLGWTQLNNAIRFAREIDADNTGKTFSIMLSANYYWKATEHMFE